MDIPEKKMELPPLLAPPLRFNTVQPNFYRGSYPRKINYPFLETLKLKTMISLTPKPINSDTDPDLYEFCTRNNINLIHVECGKSGKGKKRAVPIENTTITGIIEIILNENYSPIYIHCLNGCQITSLVIACLRKLSFWSLISIFNEFISFNTTINLNDRTFIEEFRCDLNMPANTVDWVWSGLSRDVVDKHPSIRIRGA